MVNLAAEQCAVHVVEEQLVGLAELAYSNDAACVEWRVAVAMVVVLVDGLYTATAEAEVATNARKVDPEEGLEQEVEVYSMPVAVIW